MNNKKEIKNYEALYDLIENTKKEREEIEKLNNSPVNKKNKLIKVYTTLLNAAKEVYNNDDGKGRPSIKWTSLPDANDLVTDFENYKKFIGMTFRKGKTNVFQTDLKGKSKELSKKAIFTEVLSELSALQDLKIEVNKQIKVTENLKEKSGSVQDLGEKNYVNDNNTKKTTEKPEDRDSELMDEIYDLQVEIHAFSNQVVDSKFREEYSSKGKFKEMEEKLNEIKVKQLNYLGKLNNFCARSGLIINYLDLKERLETDSSTNRLPSVKKSNNFSDIIKSEENQKVVMKRVNFIFEFLSTVQEYRIQYLKWLKEDMEKEKIDKKESNNNVKVNGEVLNEKIKSNEVNEEKGIKEPKKQEGKISVKDFENLNAKLQKFIKDLKKISEYTNDNDMRKTIQECIREQKDAFNELIRICKPKGTPNIKSERLNELIISYTVVQSPIDLKSYGLEVSGTKYLLNFSSIDRQNMKELCEKIIKNILEIQRLKVNLNSGKSLDRQNAKTIEVNDQNMNTDESNEKPADVESKLVSEINSLHSETSEFATKFCNSRYREAFKGEFEQMEELLDYVKTQQLTKLEKLNDFCNRSELNFDYQNLRKQFENDSSINGLMNIEKSGNFSKKIENDKNQKMIMEKASSILEKLRSVQEQRIKYLKWLKEDMDKAEKEKIEKKKSNTNNVKKMEKVNGPKLESSKQEMKSLETLENKIKISGNKLERKNALNKEQVKELEKSLETLESKITSDNPQLQKVTPVNEKQLENEKVTNSTKESVIEQNQKEIDFKTATTDQLLETVEGLCAYFKTYNTLELKSYKRVGQILGLLRYVGYYSGSGIIARMRRLFKGNRFRQNKSLYALYKKLGIFASNAKKDIKKSVKAFDQVLTNLNEFIKTIPLKKHKYEPFCNYCASTLFQTGSPETSGIKNYINAIDKSDVDTIAKLEVPLKDAFAQIKKHMDKAYKGYTRKKTRTGDVRVKNRKTFKI